MAEITVGRRGGALTGSISRWQQRGGGAGRQQRGISRQPARAGGRGGGARGGAGGGSGAWLQPWGSAAAGEGCSSEAA